MIVVSDTSAIIALIKCNQIDLLYQLYGEILIPDGVHKELLAGKEQWPKEIEIFNSKNYFKKVSVDKNIVDQFIEDSGLHLGESEAIKYAQINNADKLLVDDENARRFARIIGLNYIGAIGVLVEAYEKNFISSFEVYQGYDELKNKNFYLGDKVLRKVIERVGYKNYQEYLKSKSEQITLDNVEYKTKEALSKYENEDNNIFQKPINDNKNIINENPDEGMSGKGEL